MTERAPDVTKAAGMCPHGNFPGSCQTCKQEQSVSQEDTVASEQKREPSPMYSEFRSGDVRWPEVPTQQILEYFDAETRIDHPRTETDENKPRAQISETSLRAYERWLEGATREIHERIRDMEREQVRTQEFLMLPESEQGAIPINKRPFRLEFIHGSISQLKEAL